MNIEKIIIKKSLREKILNKHNIERTQIEYTIFEGNPIYLKTKNNNYLCIGNKYEYITIIFKKEKNNAIIITAYPSSKWQVKLYKRKK